MDGRIYVGASQRDSLEIRKTEHKSRVFAKKDIRHTPLYTAIRQHGWDMFLWSILEKCEDAESLYVAEKKWIARLESALHDNGYNLTLGGLGSPGYDPPESARRKISIIHKGRKHSREFIEKRMAALRKLHPSFAPEILFRRNAMESFASIARDYGVTGQAIFHFCKRHMA